MLTNQVLCLNVARCELQMIGLFRVKEFLVVFVSLLVVLAFLDIEVGNPAEFAHKVSCLADFGVFGHPSTLDVVVFERVVGPLGPQNFLCLDLDWFVEEFLQRDED